MWMDKCKLASSACVYVDSHFIGRVCWSALTFLGLYYQEEYLFCAHIQSARGVPILVCVFWFERAYCHPVIRKKSVNFVGVSCGHLDTSFVYCLP